MGADFGKYKVIEKGQFAMAPMALYYGAIGRLIAVDIGAVSPAYEVFELMPGHDQTYFEYLLRGSQMLARYSAASRGGNKIGKRQTTSFDDFCAIPLEVPGLPEQRAIARVLGGVEEQISRSIQALRLAKAVQNRLMLGLLSGKYASGPRKSLPGPWPIGRLSPEIDTIPKDWDLVRLTSVARLESGHTPSRAHPEYWGGDVPWISLQDIQGLSGRVVCETQESISDLGLKNSSARVLPAGSVVFSRTASIGHCTLLGKPMATSQDFANYVCGPKVVPRFLMELFRAMTREWRRLSEGSTHKTIYMPVFENMQILVPPIEVQHEIASAGQEFASHIQAETAHLTALRTFRRHLADALLSGRLRIPAHLWPAPDTAPADGAANAA